MDLFYSVKITLNTIQIAIFSKRHLAAKISKYFMRSPNVCMYNQERTLISNYDLEFWIAEKPPASLYYYKLSL